MDLISHGLTMIRDTFTPLIFNDHLYDKLRVYQEEVWEVLEYFDVARKAYERVLARPTRQVEVAKNVTCLLVWLETIVGMKVLQEVSTMASGSTMLSQLVAEVDAVHRYIVHGQDPLPEHLEGIPSIVALCGHGRLVDFRFFKFHRGLVARGLDVIRSNAAPLIFNDHLYAMLRRYKGEADTVANATMPPELMEPFTVYKRTTPEDSQTVFVSFPVCPPVNAQQIWDYFERFQGFESSIDTVGMELPRAGLTPKHGVIVFNSAELKDEATFNETAIFFRVNGHDMSVQRDMWVQHYRPLY
ncbi:hypothetical protein QOZ80_2AG0116630 [Eleusine coracana subsp. coracana]|nr:hypothetical protein QOZ80_2AG0116630 [Eleusine coracana subsp. coracana]